VRQVSQVRQARRGRRALQGRRVWPDLLALQAGRGGRGRLARPL